MNTKIKKTQLNIPKRLADLFAMVFFVFLIHGLFMGESFAATDEEIARQFFPQRLTQEAVDDFNRGGPPPFQGLDFVVADLNGTGPDFIVVAYTNGFSGAVRVLRRQGDTAVLVDEPNLRLFVE